LATKTSDRSAEDAERALKVFDLGDDVRRAIAAEVRALFLKDAQAPPLLASDVVAHGRWLVTMSSLRGIIGDHDMASQRRPTR
jgi:hypothetical protein